MAPAAAMVWPSIDLLELTATRRAWSPSTALMARVSVTSFCTVEVPWALTYSTVSGARPASARAPRMASTAPSPEGWVSVIR